MTFLDPNHDNAIHNKIYYETILNNRTLTEQQQKGDMDINDSENLQLISTINKDEKYQIKNQRPDDVGKDRDDYEELCRQNGTQVKFR